MPVMLIISREFELMFLNGSWVDAPDCQQIRHTHCDLTFDLGSDSDYNLQVRAQCGSLLSPWTRLSRPFNRRDSKTQTTDDDVQQVFKPAGFMYNKILKKYSDP
eukprot:superscaffoldBa00009835_g24338